MQSTMDGLLTAMKEKVLKEFEEKMKGYANGQEVYAELVKAIDVKKEQFVEVSSVKRSSEPAVDMEQLIDSYSDVRQWSVGE